MDKKHRTYLEQAFSGLLALAAQLSYDHEGMHSFAEWVREQLNDY